MRSAIYVIEGGNSRVHHGCYDEGVMRSVRHTNYPSNDKDFDSVIDDILREYRRWGAPARVVLATVSARWGQTLIRELREAIERDILVIRNPSDIGIRVLYADPDSYGVDRALAAFGAYLQAGAACVVIDAGTAVTVDALDADGAVAGGFIFPGLAVTGNSLARNTSLPVVDPRTGRHRIGTSTETCISNAALAGWIAAVEHLADIGRKAVGATGPIILTGGDSDILGTALQHPSFVYPELTLLSLGRVRTMLQSEA